MREIKFRVWSEDDKEMLYTRDINWDYDWATRDFHWFSWDSLDSAELMQYTWLKDKNGVEIYEWDILEIDKWYDGKYKREVEYYEWRFAPLVQVEYWYNAIDNYYPNSFEVVWNIYQNPELLSN